MVLELLLYFVYLKLLDQEREHIICLVMLVFLMKLCPPHFLADYSLFLFRFNEICKLGIVFALDTLVISDNLFISQKLDCYPNLLIPLYMCKCMIDIILELTNWNSDKKRD